MKRIGIKIKVSTFLILTMCSFVFIKIIIVSNKVIHFNLQKLRVHNFIHFMIIEKKVLTVVCLRCNKYFIYGIAIKKQFYSFQLNPQ